MAITAVIPALVSANLNKFFFERSIARNITNTEWESELLEEGKTLDILAPTPATISDYVHGSGITWEDSGFTKSTLTIDQDKYFAVKTDKLIQVQAKKGVDINNSIVDRTLPNMVLEADKYILSLVNDTNFTTNAKGTTLAPIAINSANILETLSEIGVTLTETNVPEGDRMIVLPPGIFAKIDLAGITLDTDNSEILAMGYRGKFAGFDIFESNQVNQLTGGDAGKYKIIAGSYSTFAFANQFVNVETVDKFEGDRGSGIRGWNVFGADIINEDKAVILTATVAAEA
jgi:hypothetical protein